MPETSPLTQKLIKDFNRPKKGFSENTKIPTIEVDEITIRVASFYEKIRSVIDWRGEHLLKRNAIERILRRKMFSKTALQKDISSIPARPLIVDLIRSGHFKNKTIPETKVKEVQNILDKYLYVIKHFPKKNGSKISFESWLFSIAACEIEETLSKSNKERALLFYAFHSLKKNIKVEKEINEEEKTLLLYIAIQQALFNLDSPIITYHILKLKYKNWKEISQEELKELPCKITKEKKEIEHLIKNSLLKKFYRFCKVYNTPYLLIGDILCKKTENKAKEIFSSPENTEKEILEAYGERTKKMRGRLLRAAAYATISIFITNIAALLVIEIPFSRYINIGEFTPFVVLIDVLVPTLLMALLVLSVSPPPEKNKKRVVLETMKIIYKKGEEEENKYLIKKPRKKRKFLYFIVSSFYGISFCASVGIIIWLLSLINFPLLSYFVFIVFLSLIAFAGVKIRERSKELYMIEIKESFFSILIDLFALPVIQFGKWLTLRWEKYNLVSILFGALLDMPFKFFLEILDEWRNYLKEKKEGIY